MNNIENSALPFFSLLIYVPLIALFVQVYNNRENQKFPIQKERYEKVIFPIFNLIEPYLYKDLPQHILHKINIVIEDNRHIADYRLIYWVCKYENSIEDNKKINKNFKNLCDYICEQLDFRSKQMGLSKRPYRYKLLKNQYYKWWSLAYAKIEYCFKLVIVGFFIITISLLGLLMIISALQLYKEQFG